MKIKKGDNVLITAGKDKGRTGKIIKALPQELKVLVEGINLKKKHVRPKREGEKGQREASVNEETERKSSEMILNHSKRPEESIPVVISRRRGFGLGLKK